MLHPSNVIVFCFTMACKPTNSVLYVPTNALVSATGSTLTDREATGLSSVKNTTPELSFLNLFKLFNTEIYL